MTFDPTQRRSLLPWSGARTAVHSTQVKLIRRALVERPAPAGGYQLGHFRHADGGGGAEWNDRANRVRRSGDGVVLADTPGAQRTAVGVRDLSPQPPDGLVRRVRAVPVAARGQPGCRAGTQNFAHQPTTVFSLRRADAAFTYEHNASTESNGRRVNRAGPRPSTAAGGLEAGGRGPDRPAGGAVSSAPRRMDAQPARDALTLSDRRAHDDPAAGDRDPSHRQGRQQLTPTPCVRPPESDAPAARPRRPSPVRLGSFGPRGGPRDHWLAWWQPGAALRCARDRVRSSGRDEFLREPHGSRRRRRRARAAENVAGSPRESSGVGDDPRATVVDHSDLRVLGACVPGWSPHPPRPARCPSRRGRRRPVAEPPVLVNTGPPTRSGSHHPARPRRRHVRYPPAAGTPADEQAGPGPVPWTLPLGNAVVADTAHSIQVHPRRAEAQRRSPRSIPAIVAGRTGQPRCSGRGLRAIACRVPGERWRVVYAERRRDADSSLICAGRSRIAGPALE
jgi:hypothetical protein